VSTSYAQENKNGKAKFIFGGLPLLQKGGTASRQASVCPLVTAHKKRFYVLRYFRFPKVVKDGETGKRASDRHGKHTRFPHDFALFLNISFSKLQKHVQANFESPNCDLCL